MLCRRSKLYRKPNSRAGLAKGVIKSMYRYEKTNVNCQTRSVNPEPQTRYQLVGESWREIICTCERPP